MQPPAFGPTRQEDAALGAAAALLRAEFPNLAPDVIGLLVTRRLQDDRKAGRA